MISAMTIRWDGDLTAFPVLIWNEAAKPFLCFAVNISDCNVVTSFIRGLFQTSAVSIPVANMNNDPTAIIEVPGFYMADIRDLLYRLTQGSTSHGQTFESYLERLAVLVDWLDACFTDAQLKAAVLLIGRREDLSPPPPYWVCPWSSMTTPLGTTLSLNNEA